MIRTMSYWALLILFSAMMIGSAIGYLTGTSQLISGLHQLGYPDYFRRLLATGKLLGVAALLLPGVPPVAREWAFAGFGIMLLAAIASYASVTGFSPLLAAPAVAFAILIAIRFLAKKN